MQTTPELTQVVVVVDGETAVSTPTAQSMPPTHTASPPATSTHTPPPTEPPTATVTPTPSPTISVRVFAGTAVPQSNQPITTDNVTQLTELARWGRGVINDIALSGNGRWVAVGSSEGIVHLWGIPSP